MTATTNDNSNYIQWINTNLQLIKTKYLAETGQIKRILLTGKKTFKPSNKNGFGFGFDTGLRNEPFPVCGGIYFFLMFGW